MMKVIPAIVSILIVGLFLVSKLLPYKDKLSAKYRKVFDFLNKIFSPIFNLLKQVVKPVQVGAGLFVDMSQIVLLAFLLLLLIFLK